MIPAEFTWNQKTYIVQVSVHVKNPGPELEEGIVSSDGNCAIYKMSGIHSSKVSILIHNVYFESISKRMQVVY